MSRTPRQHYGQPRPNRSRAPDPDPSLSFPGNYERAHSFTPASSTSERMRVSPAIEQPEEFTHFSYDQDHNYQPDNSSLSRYYAPSCGVSLSAGFDTFRKWDNPVEGLKIQYLLESIRRKEAESSCRIPADFVLWRGMATKIMMASFEPSTAFCIDIVSRNNTIYMQENEHFRLHQHDAEKSRSWSGPHSSDLMSFWGYKFETLATLPLTSRPGPGWEDDRDKATVDNYAQFASIVRYRLGRHRLVLGGEVDCIDPPPPSPDTPPRPHRLPEYVELKTSAFPRGDGRAFRRKLFNSWAQSFLLGIPNVIFGFRDQDGILLEVERFRTEQLLQRMGRDGSGIEAGNEALHFLSDVLDFINTHVSGTDAVWTLVNSSSSGVQLRRMATGSVEDIVSKGYLQHLDELACTETPDSVRQTELIQQREMNILLETHRDRHQAQPPPAPAPALEGEKYRAYASGSSLPRRPAPSTSHDGVWGRTSGPSYGVGQASQSWSRDGQTNPYRTGASSSSSVWNQGSSAPRPSTSPKPYTQPATPDDRAGQVGKAHWRSPSSDSRSHNAPSIWRAKPEPES